MNRSFLQSRRILSARRIALLTTTIAGIGAAAVFFAPNIASSGHLLGTAAQAQNLTEKVQQLPQRPVGFADIVEKVKPAVISVRVKIERSADASQNGEDDLPFPPGSPFEKFFRNSACRTCRTRRTAKRSSPVRVRAFSLPPTAMR
jgi:serine protease Do